MDRIFQSENRFDRPRILTPELAMRDPNRYKEELFSIMSGKAPLAHAVIIKLFEKGIWTPEKLNLLQNSQEPSGFDVATHQIDLNVYPLSREKKIADIYEDQRFSGDMEMIYVLNHEISHLVSKLAILDELRNESVTEEISSMTEAFFDMRKSEPNMALTRQGTVMGYREEARRDGIQEGVYPALEDIAELINMFTLDPNYLKSYLRFLTDPSCRQQKRILRLKEISSEVANLIYDHIHNCVKALLQS